MPLICAISMDISLLFKIIRGSELDVLTGKFIVDVLILDEHCHTFCQLKNAGRLFIIKSKANTQSVIDEFVW